MGNLQTTNRRGHRLVLMGNKAYKLEQYHDAIDFHLQALQFLKNNALERADCLDYLVKEYWRIGDLEKALTCSTEALAIKEKRVPGSNGLAKTLSDIGCIFYERGEYDKALRLLKGALVIREKTVPGSLGVAVSSTNLALVLSKMGRREEALRHHEQARQIKEAKAPGSASLARTYISLSNNAPSLELALAMLDKATSIARGMKPVPTSLMASIHVNRGNALLAMGNNAQAIRYYERAIEKEQRVAPDSLIMASMLNQLAKACDEQGLQPEARAARGKSIDIRHRRAPSYLEYAVSKKEDSLGVSL